LVTHPYIRSFMDVLVSRLCLLLLCEFMAYRLAVYTASIFAPKIRVPSGASILALASQPHAHIFAIYPSQSPSPSPSKAVPQMQLNMLSTSGFNEIDATATVTCLRY